MPLVFIQAVKRNIDRFPYDFIFQLTKEEFENLKSQFVTSSWGGRRYLPYAFTEQGVAMLSSVLIMQKVKNMKEREYYIASGIKFGWSRNVLLNQIKANAYVLSQRKKTYNFPKALPVHLAEQADECRTAN